MRNSRLLTVGYGILGSCATALAGVDFEIDKLNCVAQPGQDFVLCVDYGVEIEWDEDDRDEAEEARRPLELRLQVLECGELAREEDGSPIELVIPLDQPTDVDDDEIEFRGQVKFVLPPAPAYVVSNYQARAILTTAGTQHTLDVETARADDPTPRYIGVSVGVGHYSHHYVGVHVGHIHHPVRVERHYHHVPVRHSPIHGHRSYHGGYRHRR